MKIALNAPTEFVNINGEVWDGRRCQRESVVAAQKIRPASLDVSHKGYRVVGIPPGAFEEARDAHARLVDMAQKSGGKPIKPFDPESWRQAYRKKAVRAKPYELREAADQCADMARKGGWIAVDVLALRKE